MTLAKGPRMAKSIVLGADAFRLSRDNTSRLLRTCKRAAQRRRWPATEREPRAEGDSSCESG